MSTIVIRGATDNYMDDIERAVDDGVNVFKGVCKDGRLTAGGGSTEIELARQVCECDRCNCKCKYDGLPKPNQPFISTR